MGGLGFFVSSILILLALRELKKDNIKFKKKFSFFGYGNIYSLGCK